MLGGLFSDLFLDFLIRFFVKLTVKSFILKHLILRILIEALIYKNNIAFIKVRFLILFGEFLNCSCSSTMPLSFKYHFKALNECSLILCSWNENLFASEFPGE